MTAKLGYMSKGTFAPHEKNIPMLPGNNFHDDPLLRRGRATHTLDIKQGTMVAVSTIEPTYQPPAYKRMYVPATSPVSPPGLLVTTPHHWGGGGGAIPPNLTQPSKVGPNFLLGLRPIKKFLWRFWHQLV